MIKDTGLGVEMGYLLLFHGPAEGREGTLRLFS